jgi:hypothetical protein
MEYRRTFETSWAYVDLSLTAKIPSPDRVPEVRYLCYQDTINTYM